MIRAFSILVIACALVCGSAVLAASFSPTEVWVDDDFTPSTPGWGITHFDSIQDGVDAVAPAGIVHVESGVYAENVTFLKSVELSGSDKNSTIIDGGGVGAVVTMENGDGSIISGFTLRNTGVTWGSAGVKIGNVNDTVVSDNLFHDVYTGIQLDGTSGHVLSCNEIENSIHNGIGVYTNAGDCHEITVTGNTIHASGRAGVMFYGPANQISDSVISLNTITDSFRAGIYIDGEYGFTCTNATVSGNGISGSINGEGMYLNWLDHSTISGNSVADNYDFGIILNYQCDYNTIADNDVSGNDFIGIANFSSDYITMEGNRLTANANGIAQSSSDHSSIKRNLLINQEYACIHLIGCTDNLVQENIIQGSVKNSGILILSGSHCQAIGNIIRDCELEGITTYDPNESVFISGNIMVNCRNGIYLHGSPKNTLITGNVMALNREYGLYSNGFNTEGTVVHHNVFVENALANAYDTKVTTWDDGYPSGGNYWSDYAGADLDGDGIGDSPYPIPGGSNQDLFPLMSPPGGGALWADTHVVSAASGGTVNFTVHGSAPNAGRHYLLLGGMSGTEPGTPLPGGLATLPVNWDVYTDLVWTYINTPAFSDFLGVLDLQGTATARMQLPPIMPIAVGSRMYLAYTCNNPFDVASNPVIIQIVE